MAELQHTTWHNMPALTLQNDRLRVVMVPNLGAKIVSLFDKRANHEWLVPPMREVKQTSYGARFADQDMCGWDEMMPTINACAWDDKPFPDHGEVWSIPWQEEPADREAVLSVSGVELSYRLTRSAALVGGKTVGDTIRLRYHLINTGTEPFPYLWAAHPQFFADEQTRILLPPEVTEVVNVMGEVTEWGKNGDRLPWPNAPHLRPLDRVAPVEARNCRKFYTPPEQPVGWAALLHEGLGCQLRLSWNPADLPYLGLWVDEGTYNARPVAALEPATAYYDSLALAAANGTAPSLQPGMEKTWEMLVQFC